MNVKKIFSILLIALNLSSLSLFCFSRFSKPKYISVEKVESKSKPSFWGSGSDIFYYGEAVVVVEESGQWIKVSDKATSKKSGWIKESAVTSRKIVGRAGVSVNANELALAGKGFSSPVEAAYGQGFGLDFSVIDEIENIFISDSEIKKFITSGGLRGAE